MRSRRAIVLAVAGALVARAAAAEPQYDVVGVADAERVVIDLRGMPVEVALAHIAVPPAQRAQCKAKLTELAKGKKAELRWIAEFGTDANGTARVHLLVDGKDLADELVAEGDATYQPAAKPAPAYDLPLKAAQERAKAAKAGVWGAAATKPEPAVVAVKPKPPETAPTPAPAKPAAPVRGPFCSEQDSPYYQASDDPAVASIAPSRLIYYPSEAVAQKAGKKRREDPTANLPTGQDLATADSIEAQAEDLYSHAIQAGNTPRRDELYGQAFQVFSKAAEIYGALVDQNPDDDALAEKLRRCMQLRYGSLKQRRAE